MAHSIFHTTARRLATLALLGGGIAQADEITIVTAHSRDANGIAQAITQIMPSIGDCLESDRTLGGPSHLQAMIAFDVIESGEIGSLVIHGLQDRTHLSSLPSCLEGTLAALRFTPGGHTIPVQLPLEVTARTEP